MFTNSWKTKEGGYTIIETMIAISLFLVIVMAGMGALLAANRANQKSHDMRTVLDGASFILEDISRTLRTGSTYRCMATFSATSITTPQSCSSGRVIAFEDILGNKNSSADQWVYKIESSNGGASYNIFRSSDSGTTWAQLNPPGLTLSSLSYFAVLGAPAPTAPDAQQPLAIVRLAGTITFKGEQTSFSIQTAVSQRLPDLQ